MHRPGNAGEVEDRGWMIVVRANHTDTLLRSGFIAFVTLLTILPQG